MLPPPCQHMVCMVSVFNFKRSVGSSVSRNHLRGSRKQLTRLKLVYNLHFLVDEWCWKLSHVLIDPSYITLIEMSVQVLCPHFTELCVFLLGYRRSGAFHTLKRALKIVLRTFDQNRCIWAHSVSLRPHPGIPFIPHIIFLSFLCSLNGLILATCRWNTQFLLHMHTKSQNIPIQYMKADVE